MDDRFTTASYYLPEHHALCIYGSMSGYLIDYYLNLKANECVLTPQQDEELKKLLASLAIHITLRSPDESIAWTLHMQSETPYSLFATGSSADNFLVGQVLTENIRHTDMSIFHSQVSRKLGNSSKSIVKCESNDIATMVEMFYAQSEQLPLKLEISQTSDEVFALIAMPGFDESWFNVHSATEVHTQLASLPHKLMKECVFHYRCDCSVDKLLPFLSSVAQDTLEELYGTDAEIVASCPRCGRKFTIERETVDAMRVKN